MWLFIGERDAPKCPAVNDHRLRRKYNCPVWCKGDRVISDELRIDMCPISHTNNPLSRFQHLFVKINTKVE